MIECEGGGEERGRLGEFGWGDLLILKVERQVDRVDVEQLKEGVHHIPPLVGEFQVCLEVIYRGDELCDERQVPPVSEPILGPHVHCCRTDPDTYLEELEVVAMVGIGFWNEEQVRDGVR